MTISVTFGSNGSLASMATTATTGSRTGSHNSLSSLASSNRGAHSANNRKRRMQVQFAADNQVEEVECFKLADNKDDLWYGGRDMALMRKQQLKELKQAQRKVDICGIPMEEMTHGELTWRGFEDIEGGWCRVETSGKYTGQVVHHYKIQKNSGYNDPDELRVIAKALSKQERNRARNMAVKDAKAVGMPHEAKRRLRKRDAASSSSSSCCTSSSMKKTYSASGMLSLVSTKGMRRNISGGLSALMKKGFASSSSAPQSESKRNATFSIRAASA